MSCVPIRKSETARHAGHFDAQATNVSLHAFRAARPRRHHERESGIQGTVAAVLTVAVAFSCESTSRRSGSSKFCEWTRAEYNLFDKDFARAPARKLFYAPAAHGARRAYDARARSASATGDRSRQAHRDAPAPSGAPRYARR